MIPKVIHYCWFGGNDFSDKENECINSWKKFCPDYEIVRWDETNFDVSSNRYVTEAYKRGKWAFVSDYARFKILYENGGVYFDTDVEIVKSIDDIISQGPFFGVEQGDSKLGGEWVAPGLGMGAYKGDKLYKEVIDYYDNASFIEGDVLDNTKTIVEIVTEIFIKYGFKPSTSIQRTVGFNLYPPEYFDPMDYKTGIIEITNNTHSIHHYAGTWLSPESQKIQNVRYKLVKIFGKRVGLFFSDIYGVFIRLKYRVKTRGLKSSIAFYWNRAKVLFKDR